MKRIWQTAGLYTLDPWGFFRVPAIVMIVVASLTYLIGSIVVGGRAETAITAGSIESVYWATFGVTIGAVTGMLRFTSAIGLTRRMFYFGTLAFTLAFNAVLAVILTLLGQLEMVTDAFGTNISVFVVVPIDGPWWARLLTFFGIGLLVMTTPFWFICAYQRWRGRGLLVAFVAVFLVVAITVLAATALNWWPAIGRFLSEVSLATAGLAVTGLAAVIAAATWPVLSRTTP